MRSSTYLIHTLHTDILIIEKSTEWPPTRTDYTEYNEVTDLRCIPLEVEYSTASCILEVEA